MVKVAVLGASGGIGQPLALLLKMHPLVTQLSLYDVINTLGVAADLSHVDTGARVTAHTRDLELEAALKGSELVLIPAGVPRKPGMTRDDLFNVNAKIVKTLCEGIAEHCPNAWIGVISNPVNSTVAIAAEVLKQKGVFEPKRLFGVTTLDVVRSRTFIGEILGIHPKEVQISVVGGHAGKTILPLLSQCKPPLTLDADKAAALTQRIQNAGTEVVNAKAGTGSATLSMAYAAAQFAESCLKAMKGEEGIVECAFVASNLTELPYFASRVRLGTTGIEEFLPIGNLSETEAEALEKLKPELAGSIEKGINFVAA